MNRQEHYKRFITVNKRYEDKYYPVVKNSLIPPGLIPAIKHVGLHGGVSFLNSHIVNPKLTTVIRTLYLEVGLRHARMDYLRMKEENKDLRIVHSPHWYAYESVMKEMGKKSPSGGFGLNYEWTRFILDYLNRFLIEKITFDVTTTTRNELLRVIQLGITNGTSIDEMVNQIEGLPFLKYQAARIVGTEVNKSANVGSKAQSNTFPYEQMKEWISAHDLRVRGISVHDHASHIDLDGVKINSWDLFIDPRNGDRLDHPGDPKASAASTVNCRCTLAYTAKRDTNGKLIPKRQTTTVIFPNQNINRTVITI